VVLCSGSHEKPLNIRQWVLWCTFYLVLLSIRFIGVVSLLEGFFLLVRKFYLAYIYTFLHVLFEGRYLKGLGGKSELNLSLLVSYRITALGKK